MIVKEENNIIVLNNNNNGIKLNTISKNVFILIWNNIEKKFNEIPSTINYNKQLKKLNLTHEETIEMNTVISQPNGKKQLNIINLMKKYDKENYKAYDHTTKENIMYRGLTAPQEEQDDDYLYMMNDIKNIEENPTDWNTSYDQLTIWLPNKFLGNIVAPSNCWRIQ